MLPNIMITISASICGLLITVPLLINSIIGCDWKEKVNHWFFAMLITNLIGNFCEIVVAFLNGRAGHRVTILIHVLEFINYIGGSFILVFFAQYLYEYISIQIASSRRISSKQLFSKKPFSKKSFSLASYLSIFNIPILVIAQTTPFFFQIDEYNYVYPKDIIWIVQILPALTMLVLFVTILKNRKSIKSRAWISMLIYVVIIAVCYMIEDMNPGVWVSYLGSAIAALIIYINIQDELRQRVKEQELELEKSRTAIMISQIQPHFLYNSLTAISKLCDIRPDKAKIAITDFADYLRRNLESINNDKLIFFESELEHVEAYLALEQLRYNDMLEVEYEIDVMDFILPPITVQPLVENAVRHGLMEREGGGKVRICTEVVNRAVCISVIDNGVGFDADTYQNDGKLHIGIENVRARLFIMCRGTLEITSVAGGGTTATITIPYGIDEKEPI